MDDWYPLVVIVYLHDIPSNPKDIRRERTMGIFYIQEIDDFTEVAEILSPDMVERFGGNPNIKKVTVSRNRMVPFWRGDALKVTQNPS
jgi:hypothetical protein